MTELEFLNGEAKIASMAAPKGLAISVVSSDQKGKFDVLFGGRVVARLLGREEALAAVVGIGGALTILKPTKAVKGRKRAIKIVDRCEKNWSKTFETDDACRAWLMEGLAATEGAEQEHFSRMLVELQAGAKTLHYN